MSLFSNEHDQRSKRVRVKTDNQPHPKRTALNVLAGKLRKAGISQVTINDCHEQIIALHKAGRTWQEIAETL